MKATALKWLKEWEGLINRVDFAAARHLFADDVVSFGTFAEILHGLDDLEQRQWRKIWPTIADFTFEEPEIRVYQDTAAIIVLWHSKGRTGDGGWYPRKGRATLILKEEKGKLHCIHSHLSMEPDIPPLAGQK